mgnify:CR=1 FL=1
MERRIVQWLYNYHNEFKQVPLNFLLLEINFCAFAIVSDFFPLYYICIDQVIDLIFLFLAILYVFILFLAILYVFIHFTLGKKAAVSNLTF